jgi:hypothetical protein
MFAFFLRLYGRRVASGTTRPGVKPGFAGWLRREKRSITNLPFLALLSLPRIHYSDYSKKKKKQMENNRGDGVSKRETQRATLVFPIVASLVMYDDLPPT